MFEVDAQQGPAARQGLERQVVVVEAKATRGERIPPNSEQLGAIALGNQQFVVDVERPINAPLVCRTQTVSRQGQRCPHGHKGQGSISCRLAAAAGLKLRQQHGTSAAASTYAQQFEQLAAFERGAIHCWFIAGVVLNWNDPRFTARFCLRVIHL